MKKFLNSKAGVATRVIVLIIAVVAIWLLQQPTTNSNSKESAILWVILLFLSVNALRFVVLPILIVISAIQGFWLKNKKSWKISFVVFTLVEIALIASLLLSHF